MSSLSQPVSRLGARVAPTRTAHHDSLQNSHFQPPHSYLALRHPIPVALTACHSLTQHWHILMLQVGERDAIYDLPRLKNRFHRDNYFTVA
jgi:hypothetical protein